MVRDEFTIPEMPDISAFSLEKSGIRSPEDWCGFYISSLESFETVIHENDVMKMKREGTLKKFLELCLEVSKFIVNNNTNKSAKMETLKDKMREIRGGLIGLEFRIQAFNATLFNKEIDLLKEIQKRIHVV